MPVIEDVPFDVIRCVDYLLTRALRRAPALLHSDYATDEGSWRITGLAGEAAAQEEIIRVTPDRAYFRAALAHLGVRFMSGRVQGGFAEGFLSQSGASHYFALYTANDAFRGYWVRLYVRAT